MQVKLVGNRDKMIGKCFALLANSSISLAEVSTDPGGKTLKICVYAKYQKLQFQGFIVKKWIIQLLLECVRDSLKSIIAHSEHSGIISQYHPNCWRECLVLPCILEVLCGACSI